MQWEGLVDWKILPCTKGPITYSIPIFLFSICWKIVMKRTNYKDGWDQNRSQPEGGCSSHLVIADLFYLMWQNTEWPIRKQFPSNIKLVCPVGSCFNISFQDIGSVRWALAHFRIYSIFKNSIKYILPFSDSRIRTCSLLIVATNSNLDLLYFIIFSCHQ